MADGQQVQPHHVLRALLDDARVRGVLGELGVDPDEVRVTLERVWLDSVDVLDVEQLSSVGVDVPTLLAAVSPPFDEQPEWQGRRLAQGTRDVLVRALCASARMHQSRTTTGHLLLGLLASDDAVVSIALVQHGVSARAARRVLLRHPV